MKIPYCRPFMLPEDERVDLALEVYDVISSGIITNNTQCRKLEEWFIKNQKCDYAVAFSSCSQALYACIRALKPNSIQIPAFTWKTYEHILIEEDVTNFFDIDLETWLPIFKPVIPSDLIITNSTFGNYDNPPKAKLGQNILCDHAFSVGLKIGDIGSVSVFSMTATKTVTACEGGIAVTNNSYLAKKLVEIRDKISRMSEVHAVIGLRYLPHLEEIIEKKRHIFDFYKAHLPFQFQKTAKDFSYGYCGILIDRKKEFMEAVKDRMEVQSKYEPLWGVQLENTQYVFDRIVLLPAYADLDPRKVVDIIEEEWLK